MNTGRRSRSFMGGPLGRNRRQAPARRGDLHRDRSKSDADGVRAFAHPHDGLVPRILTGTAGVQRAV